MDGTVLGLFLLATFVGGVVTGLAGFAMGLVVSGIWLHILTPIQTAILIVGYGLLVQGYGIWKLRHALHWEKVWPYIVGGAGMMHVRVDLNGGLQNVSNLQAMDLGAGVTGFLTRRVGLSWDVRYFRSVDRTRENGFSIDSEHLSFWRASMALVFRV